MNQKFFKKIALAASMMALPVLLNAGGLVASQSQNTNTMGTARSVCFAIENEALGKKYFTLRPARGGSMTVYVNSVIQELDRSGVVAKAETVLAYQFDDGEYCIVSHSKAKGSNYVVSGVQRLQQMMMSRPSFATIPAQYALGVMGVNSAGGGGGDESEAPHRVDGEDDLLDGNVPLPQDYIDYIPPDEANDTTPVVFTIEIEHPTLGLISIDVTEHDMTKAAEDGGEGFFKKLVRKVVEAVNWAVTTYNQFREDHPCWFHGIRGIVHIVKESWIDAIEDAYYFGAECLEWW